MSIPAYSSGDWGGGGGGGTMQENCLQLPIQFFKCIPIYKVMLLPRIVYIYIFMYMYMKWYTW